MDYTETAVNPRAVIGGNAPPSLPIRTPEEIRGENREVFDRLDSLLQVGATVPPVIDNDDIEGRASDLVKQMKKAMAAAKSAMKVEQEPLNEEVKKIKNAFAKPIEALEPVCNGIVARLDVYKEKKAAAERRRREEEEERQRQKAEELRKEQERIAAERAKLDREKKEAEERERLAEEKRLKALQDEADAKRRAQEATEKAERLERENREREKREMAERASRQLQMELDKQAADRKAKENEERIAAQQAQLARLKAEREEADRQAAAAKQAAQAAKNEQREAQAETADLKRDDKLLAREERAADQDADRAERRADRLAGAARAPESELSRGRGDLGAVSSRASRWTYELTAVEQVPLERLRAYLSPDHIGAAVWRWMQANRLELEALDARKVEQSSELLPGVTFRRDYATRVA